MSDSNRMTFEEACQELGISEAELEQLVADGAIASVKDGDSLFFKRDVIRNYKKQQDAEPSILLSDDEINLLDDDVIDFGIEEPAPAAVSDQGPTTDLSEGDDLDLSVAAAGSDTEDTVLNLESVLDDDAEGTTPLGEEAGLLEESGGGLGEDTLLDTDILDLGDEETDTFDLDTAEEPVLDRVEDVTLLRGPGARVMQMKRKKSHAAWTALLAIAALLFFLPLSVLFSMAYLETFSGEMLSERMSSFQWIEKYGEPFAGIVKPLADLVRTIAGG
ncbi:MAG: helix-turn-helix domain-containing protein [Planctomycetes bacterium]|nr:helix-turn-helix domain-containing protein [Planctomycetota bacterium]